MNIVKKESDLLKLEEDDEKRIERLLAVK